MSKITRNEVQDATANVPVNDNGTVDIQKLSPHDRETYRQGRILDLKVDELRNGVLQGEYFHAQFQEFVANDPKNAQSLFNKFCQLCSETPAEAKKKINRFLFVNSFKNGTEREALTLLRGTLIDKIEKLKFSDKQRGELAESLAKRFKNTSLATSNLKKVQSSINSLAHAILMKPLEKLNQPKKSDKKKADDSAPKPSENLEQVTESAPQVRDVPEIKGFKLPTPDDLNAMTLEQKTDAIFRLFQATHKAALHIQEDPDEYISPDSLSEIETLVSDMRNELKVLKKRLEFRTTKRDLALSQVA